MTPEQLEKGKELLKSIEYVNSKAETIKNLTGVLYVEDGNAIHYRVPDEHAQALKDFLLSIEQKKLDQLQKEFDEL